MSAHLLAAALESDDSNIMSDCEAATRDRKHEKPLHEAMSHTETEGMHAASDEAIRHRSCPDPKEGGKKKRQSGAADVGKSAKKGQGRTDIQASIRD